MPKNSITRKQLKSLSLIDTSEPIWILGPSGNLNTYKDFILNNLQDKNTLAIGHVFPDLVLNWSFIPKFFTWFDPHQTQRTQRFFNQIQSKLKDSSKKSTAVVSDFVKNINSFPATSDYGKNKNQWAEYEKFQDTLLDFDFTDIIYAKAIFMQWINWGRNGHEVDMELTDKLCFDPNYRFHEYELTTFGTRKQYLPIKQDPRNCQLENFLTHTALPLLHFMGFKQIFILGLDGKPKKSYPWGQSKINPLHAQFCGLEKWIEWKPFHNMNFINLQSETPLTKMLETITPEQSLKY